MKKGKYLILLIILIVSIGIISLSYPSIATNSSGKILTQDSVKKGEKVNIPNYPSIVGKSAVTMVLGSDEVIYSKDANAKRYPASLTKLLTAYLFAKNAKPDDLIPYTVSASKQPAFSLGTNFGPVYVGEKMLAKYVMDALLLYSANDSAYMIADYVGGSKENFVKMMNAEIHKLGLKGTHFTNPNGLNNPDHYTTAYDVAILGQLPYSLPWSRETMGTKTATIHFQGKDKQIHIANRNANLGTNGNVAGKTGFTDEAGRCLFNIDIRDGKTLVGVVMKSAGGLTDPQMYKDMDKIMNYSFNEATQKVYEEKGTTVFTPTLTYKVFGFFGPTREIKVPLKLSSNIMYYENNENNEFSTLSLDTKGLTAWNVLNSHVNAKFTELKYSKDYALTPSITKMTLIKENLLAYIMLLVILLDAIVFIGFIAKDLIKKRG